MNVNLLGEFVQMFDLGTEVGDSCLGPLKRAIQLLKMRPVSQSGHVLKTFDTARIKNYTG